MATLGDPSAHLAEALAALRAVVAEVAYPLPLPAAAQALTARDFLVGQLDDYLVPRLDRLAAALLAVVGGSTGAGKSTLVNTLAEAPVSAVGVLRPTTRTPVLASHPRDMSWFRRPGLLPGLTRTSAAARTPGGLQLVPAPALTPGLALLDSPDIESVEESNRSLAGRLFAAADLWLLVTTAARYADAVPWQLLGTARDRGTAIALVLNRVPPEATEEVAGHFVEMLSAHGFAGLPLFVVPESVVDGPGLLPEPAIAPLRAWLGELARDTAARDATIRQTLAGAITAAGAVATDLADAADDQIAAARTLTDRVRVAYRAASAKLRDGVTDGTLIRGEVLLRWQEFLRSAELLAVARARFARLRGQIAAAVTGPSVAGRELRVAIQSSLVTLIHDAGTDAAERSSAAWRADPAGAALLDHAGWGRRSGTAEPVDLARPSPDLAWRAHRLVREWQREVQRLARAEVGGKAGTRAATRATNAIGLLVMIRVIGSTPARSTGLQAAAPDLVDAVFGDRAIGDLADSARADLLGRVRALFDAEEQRYLHRVAAAGLREEPAVRLREGAAAVARSAAAAGLGTGHARVPPAPRAPEPDTPQVPALVAAEAPQPGPVPPADTPVPARPKRRARRRAS